MLKRFLLWWRYSRRFQRMARQMAGADYYQNRHAIKRLVRINTSAVARGFDARTQVFSFHFELNRLIQGL